MNVVINAMKLMLDSGPEGAVPLRWLFKRTTSINRRFAQKATVSVTQDDLHQLVTINGETYAWPKGVPYDDLLVFASEQGQADHPHKYAWGKTRIHPGDVVLDIGACEGSFGASAAAAGAEVIAVEPSRIMQGVIRKFFEVRGLPQPRILGCLVGSSARQCYFYDNPERPGSSRVELAPGAETYPVPMRTLDEILGDLNLTRLDFIKCDAEGADVDILKSGRESLKKFRPKLALCTYHNDGDYLALFHFLQELGYHIEGKGFLHGGSKFRVHMLHAW